MEGLRRVGNSIQMIRLQDENASDPAPRLGEHTEYILKKYLGYIEEKI
jgi:crotonobetainyl-CoA:carnitine CoA-transferase CaiB-like acyl-CoA transferase